MAKTYLYESKKKCLINYMMMFYINNVVIILCIKKKKKEKCHNLLFIYLYFYSYGAFCITAYFSKKKTLIKNM